MFVGYTSSTKIWKFHDLIKKRTFTSRDVVFYEEEPYHGSKSGEVNGKSSEGMEEKGEMMGLVNWPARIVVREDIEEPAEGPRLVAIALVSCTRRLFRTIQHQMISKKKKKKKEGLVWWSCPQKSPRERQLSPNARLRVNRTAR